jgi:hypothetical protein
MKNLSILKLISHQIISKLITEFIFSFEYINYILITKFSIFTFLCINNFLQSLSLEKKWKIMMIVVVNTNKTEQVY